MLSILRPLGSLFLYCFKGFKDFSNGCQKCILSGYIKEEVYVRQPPGSVSSKFPNHVFKLQKALYGLKQAPRAWYERLKSFLLSKGFKMGFVDKTHSPQA
jgi:hypothetical protein